MPIARETVAAATQFTGTSASTSTSSSSH